MITGGNSGIGLAVAKAFAREGASVVITRRDEASLKRAERDVGESGMALRADVSRLPEIDRAMGAIRERFKRIDALFVNAGIGKFVPFDQVTEEFFDETVAVNLKGGLLHGPQGAASAPAGRGRGPERVDQCAQRDARAPRSTVPRRRRS